MTEIPKFSVPVVLSLWVLPSFLLEAPASPLAPSPLSSSPSSPIRAAADTVVHRELPSLFRTADVCMACHNQIFTSAGEDISIGSDWRASMMANSARDPYWQAAVRREILDHPVARDAIEAECSRCHMPMASYTTRAAGGEGRIFDHLPAGVARGPLAALAADGVSCAMCHQIGSQGLGEEESFVGGFQVDRSTPQGRREVFGPFEVDSGRVRVMASASGFRPGRGDHIQSSELCATCHTLITHALDEDGRVVGELPEQVPYQEWLHSDYPDEASCQSCHMPVVREPVPVTGVLGQPRDSVSRHVFRGGNFFVLSMLSRHRGELGVEALPQELDRAAIRTVAHLRSSAAGVSVEEARLVAGDRLEAVVAVTNLAGHKLPTAYPSRRAWLRVTVTDAAGDTVFASGSFRSDGAIVGNDNDRDPATFEPHHRRIESPDQVQIYEAVLAGPDGAVTTGLLTATGFAKDNRIVPRGFQKLTAGERIAVHGGAFDDPDFGSGEDRVLYSVDVSGAAGPYELEAELWYQPIGYRWARNLDGLGALETERFVDWYDGMASGSAVSLARGRVRVTR